jgi:hypothetical protein
MGQAKTKLTEDAKEIVFEYRAPEMMILEGDKANLERNLDGGSTPGSATERATRLLLQNIIMAAYPQGMGRHDGKVWGAWLETMEIDTQSTATVTMGMVKWMLKHLVNEELKVPSGMVQWREALIDYLTALHAVESEKSPDRSAES